MLEDSTESTSLDATLDQLMAKFAEEQNSRRKKKNLDGGRVWLLHILQRVVGMNPFGKAKIDALKYWSSLIDTVSSPCRVVVFLFIASFVGYSASSCASVRGARSFSFKRASKKGFFQKKGFFRKRGWQQRNTETEPLSSY